MLNLKIMNFFQNRKKYTVTELSIAAYFDQ
jgi:hypothetical protein